VIRCRSASKNQNPREGIETRLTPAGEQVPIRPLQKTKIPARGLKHLGHEVSHQLPANVASKNQNPREGIET